MHHQALEKIERHILGSLKNCDISDGWPVFDSFSRHVESLASELLKHKGQWLSVSDAFSIFYDLIYEHLRDLKRPNNEPTGRLVDLVGDDNLLQLAKHLLEFYASIPRSYDVYVAIPKISVDLTPVVLSDMFALSIFDNAKDVPGGHTAGLLGLFDNKLQPKKAYLRVTVSGYCNRNLENLTVRTALSRIKIAFQQAIAKKLLTISTGTPAGLGLLGGLTHYSVQKTKLVCVDKSSNTERTVSIELPLEVSKLLESLDLDTSNKQLAAALDAKNIDPLLISYLRLPALLMASTEPESGRVKSAIEWCFDSYATENTTMSFLQTCIGLEALFGDDADNDNLTKTLADRCAYLVGTDIKGRKTIRENFKQLYSIRSKLVHGSATSMASNEKHFLDWGRSILEYSIFKELKHLNLERPT